ncbi:hypothetical protein E2320_002289 [Naja naja]|nr:hypothetical protein E2320_002289 [Naja naja]
MLTAPTFLCFHPSTETWESYINPFDCFLDAADLSEISNHRGKGYFLSFCGAVVFDIATALLVPQTVKAVSWEDLQELLSNHYSPKPSRIVRRHAFRRQVQAEGETISTYMAALRKVALHCGFRDLEDQLLDKLVRGVRDLRLQRCLLAKGDLTLKMAVEESQAAEMSILSAAKIQGSNSNATNKPSTAVHYDDSFPDESSEAGEDVNHLRGQPPPQ